METPREGQGEKEYSTVMADELERFLVYEISLSLGILPLENNDTVVKEHLERLDPDEARRHKRKFRKQWRKLVKSRIGPGKSHSHRWYGLGNTEPEARTKLHRKQAIYYEVLRRAAKKITELNIDCVNPLWPRLY